jgi:hypothetical protein
MRVWNIYIYNYIYGTLTEYVYFVGRLKGSIYLVNERLDFRNAANSLRIEGPRVLPGTHTMCG